MPRKRPAERLVGTIKAVDIVEQPRGRKRIGEPVAIQIRARTAEGITEDWYAVAKTLKPRVRELSQVPNELIRHTFEFALGDTGEIISMTRIST